MVRRYCVNFRCRGRTTYLDNSSARAFALAVGAGGGCLEIFFISSVFSLFFPPL